MFCFTHVGNASPPGNDDTDTSEATNGSVDNLIVPGTDDTDSAETTNDTVGNAFLPGADGTDTAETTNETAETNANRILAEAAPDWMTAE